MTKALTTIFNNHHSFLKSVSWRHLARDFRFSVWISISRFESLFLGLGLCLCLGLCVKRSTSREHLTKIHKFRHHHRWCHQWWLSISILFLCSNFFFFSILVWLFVGLGLVQFIDWFFYFFIFFYMWYKDLVIFYLGLKWGLGMIICRVVGIFWFRVCLKMVLIGDFVSVCIWICAWLVIWDDFWGFQVLEFVWLCVYVCDLWDGVSV